MLSLWRSKTVWFGNALACSLVALCLAAPTLGQAPKDTQDPEKNRLEESSQKPVVSDTSVSSPATPGGTKGEPRRSNPKAGSAEANKKKAEQLLNRCYQEALGADPDLKAEALGRVAESMRKISKERALYVFQQAFDATSEMQSQDSARRKVSQQFQIVTLVAPIDLPKALELAVRMDRVYPAGDQPRQLINLRNNALGFVAAQLASKDPDRAFEVVEQQISEGNFEPDFLAPVATALRKTRPDKSEQLFLEGIHQFENSSGDPLQVQSFVDLTAHLFDLNRTLSAKALDLIIHAIDGLEKKQQEDTVAFAFTAVNDQGRTNISGIREYAAVQAVAMMRRLDPERAKSLEEGYANYREQISKNPNGLFPIGSDADPSAGSPGNLQAQAGQSGQIQKTVTAANPPAGDGSSSTGTPGSGTEQRRVVVQGPGNSSQAPMDANRIASQMQSQLQVNSAVRTAQSNPQAALNSITTLESPADRAKALALVAAVIYKTDPEKGKSLLGDAYTAAEKVSDPFDRAQIYGYLADGYMVFDRDRAKALLTEAFSLLDKVIEQETNQPSTQPFANRLPTEFRHSGQLAQQLLPSLSKLSIDEAVTRSEQISDRKIRLLTLITIADSILNDGKTESPEIRIMLN